MYKNIRTPRMQARQIFFAQQEKLEGTPTHGYNTGNNVQRPTIPRSVIKP
jgi:hypothetical protein